MTRLKTSFSILAAFAVGALVLELLSQGLFYLRHDTPFFRYERAAELAEQNRLGDFDQRFGLPGLRLHPMFGWATAPTTPGYNNAGFLSDRPYPHPREEDDFIIGIFGGSVAANFWSFNAKSGTFQNRLKERIPALGRKRIVLLNFAKEAYKSPQQLAVLSYWLLEGQHFDLVVNIEGYNELTSAWINRQRGIDLAMHGSNLLFEFARLTDAERISEPTLRHLMAARQREAAFRQSLATFWLIQTGYARWIAGSTTASQGVEMRAYDARSNLLLIPQGESSSSRETFLQHYERYWLAAARATGAVAKSAGAAYLQVLQPNQYVRTDRVYSEQERRVAFTEANGYDGLIDAGFQRMSKLGAQLTSDVGFSDATRIFDAVPGQVYRDNCCHMTDTGRTIFSRFVANAASTLLERELSQ